MKSTFTLNGGLIFFDDENKEHIFSDKETEALTTLCYKRAQLKKRMIYRGLIK